MSKYQALIDAPSLHDQIMNLPCDRSTLDWANTREAYLYGHRDARHAAAELALAQDATIRTLPADLERAEKALAALAQQAQEPVGDRYFSYSTDLGFDEYPTRDEAIECANTQINGYRDDAIRDDEWPDEVDSVCWGVILGRSREIDTSNEDHESVDYKLYAAPPAPQVPVDGLPLTQEPKYTTDGRHIINRHSGEQVPHDEPVFVFRARDAVALHALCAYFDRIQDREPLGPHAYAVAQRIDDFKAFAAQHPDRVKWPDTAARQSQAPQTKGGEA